VDYMQQENKLVTLKIDSIDGNLLVKIDSMTTWIGGKKVRKTSNRDRG
jgi:hypothetical protein